MNRITSTLDESAPVFTVLPQAIPDGGIRHFGEVLNPFHSFDEIHSKLQQI